MTNCTDTSFTCCLSDRTDEGNNAQGLAKLGRGSLPLSDWTGSPLISWEKQANLDWPSRSIQDKTGDLPNAE